LLSALVGLLETIVDPAVSALRHAQIDDEPETDEEKQEVAEAREWLRLNGRPESQPDSAGQPDTGTSQVKSSLLSA
jgi:hypothetical protein